MNLYDATVPVFTKVLGHVPTWLDKAAAFADARKFDVETLLQARLAADQWPLVRQLHAVCDGAMLGTATLAGKPSPGIADGEKSIADVRDRLHTAVEFLKSFEREDFVGADDRPCTHPSLGGQAMTAFDFLNHLVLPNYHFHLATAYAILRHNGVALGKLDYLVSLPFKAQS